METLIAQLHVSRHDKWVHVTEFCWDDSSSYCLRDLYQFNGNVCKSQLYFGKIAEILLWLWQKL